jgi:hypothetical protein
MTWVFVFIAFPQRICAIFTAIIIEKKNSPNTSAENDELNDEVLMDA